jgi:hypothetical protein
MAPERALFDTACLHCGARLIQRLGFMRLHPDQVRSRRRAVLVAWVEYGHSEAEIRALAASESMALGPVPSLASANHSQAKPRSAGRK